MTQAYLSMLERGQRPVTNSVRLAVLEEMDVDPISLPYRGKRPRSFEHALGALGYPGFGHLSSDVCYNPGELLLLALDVEDLPGRVLEALPWLPLEFPKMDWAWLYREVKLRDRQNRLAYILELSATLAEQRRRFAIAALLRKKVEELERSRLAGEDTLCYASMTETERHWQRMHRPPAAAHWNLLTHLQVEHLSHA